MKRDTMGGLDVVIGGGDDGNGGGKGPLLVLLHGFGAPGEDLVPLAWELEAPAGMRFVCPAGPISLGLPFSDARAWWMIDMNRLAAGQPRDDSWSAETPPGLAAARERVLALL